MSISLGCILSRLFILQRDFAAMGGCYKVEIFPGNVDKDYNLLELMPLRLSADKLRSIKETHLEKSLRLIQ